MPLSGGFPPPAAKICRWTEAVIRSAPSPAAYLELARLCEQTQNKEEAERFYRQGLELAAQTA